MFRPLLAIFRFPEYFKKSLYTCEGVLMKRSLCINPMIAPFLVQITRNGVINVKSTMKKVLLYSEKRGGVVVKALSYKPPGCGLDTRFCHWNFSVT